MSAKNYLTKKRGDEELCIFYGDAFPLTEVCASKRNLHTLVVIGQPSITSLDGISELVHLRELWIVECQVKETESMKRCKNLERVYLYSNQITKFGDQNHLKKLSPSHNLKELSIFGNPFCKKTRNHYQLVLQYSGSLSIVDGVEVLHPDD